MFKDLEKGIREPPCFTRFHIADVNPVSGHSKKRMIVSPNGPMRLVHGRLMAALEESTLGLFDYDAGYRSPYDNAARHLGNRYFYQTDLCHAYRSVRCDALAKVIAARCEGWQFDEIRAILARYCFERSGKGLLVGAPASPKLFNAYAHATIDGPLEEAWPLFVGPDCGYTRKRYTRYLDDLTFSSPAPISDRDRRNIRAIVTAAGFEVNHRKSAVLDIRKGPVVITGVGLAWQEHHGTRTFLPRHFLSRLKGILHLATKEDPRISRDEVEGLMGVFYGVFGRKHRNPYRVLPLNATETKVFDLYSKCRARFDAEYRRRRK